MPRFEHGHSEYAYLDAGPRDAPAVVFLHGLLVSSAVWAVPIARVSSARRALAIDWPGHGASPPLASTTSLEELGDAVIELLDLAGARRATLVGSSFGGLVALEMTARFPERVAALALISTPRGPETSDQRDRHLKTLEIAARVGQIPVLKSMALRLFGTTTRRLHPEIVAGWLESAARIDLASIRYLSTAVLTRGAPPAGTGRTPKTLVIHGEEDALVSRSEAQELAAAMGSATMTAVGASGHLVPLERPEALAELLASFLEIDRDDRNDL